MIVAVVVPFLDEEEHLAVALDSLAAQTRPANHVVLVDDGSHDRSQQIAQQFARRHARVKVLRRPARARERDRLVAASELLAFQLGVKAIDGPWDVVGKIDADVFLTPETLATLERALESDPGLGMVGAHLSEPGPDGAPARIPARTEHVHGAITLYRRECYDSITPLPPILGWDMIDAARARMNGWRTASFEVPGGDPVHLRPLGAHAGAQRSFFRWGKAAYALGEHPLHVLLYGARRMTDRPLVLGGLSYICGWAIAGIRRVPRAEAEVRAFVRSEQLRRVRLRLRRAVAGVWQ